MCSFHGPVSDTPVTDFILSLDADELDVLVSFLDADDIDALTDLIVLEAIFA